MLKPDNLFHIFGIIILLLLSIGLISYTTKFIFGVGHVKRATKPPDRVYDPDHRQNNTRICPFADDSYLVKYENTRCFNKTMMFWYVPWVRHDVWSDFAERNDERRRLRELKLKEDEEAAAARKTNESVIENEIEEPLLQENTTNHKVKDQPSIMVCAILAALLGILSTLACMEVVKDKLKRHCATDVKPEDRRCSLADFTINRHLRRESQQANMQHIQRQASFDQPAKVTQNLVHQGSLDRAISKLSSEVKPPPLIRRSSVPAHLMTNNSNAQQSDKDKLRTRNISSSSILQNMGNRSCDLSGDDSSPDMRRKSRHFIRRH